MSRFIVGMDKIYEIEADSPKEAEAELARRLNENEINIDSDNCLTYEVLPEE